MWTFWGEDFIYLCKNASLNIQWGPAKGQFRRAYFICFCLVGHTLHLTTYKKYAYSQWQTHFLGMNCCHNRKVILFQIFLSFNSYSIRDEDCKPDHPEKNWYWTKHKHWVMIWKVVLKMMKTLSIMVVDGHTFYRATGRHLKGLLNLIFLISF